MATSGEDVNDDNIVEDHVFSILPFGLKQEFDITGWQTEISDDARAEVLLIEDFELKSDVVDLASDVFYKAAISFPDESKLIGTPFRLISFHIKHLDKYTAFEVEIEDNTSITRTIRCSSAQSLSRVKSSIATMPLRLVKGWNYVVVDLADLTHRLFGSEYRQAIRVRVFANCRVRRIFFHDVLLQEHELPIQLRTFPDINVEVCNNQRSPPGETESLQ